MLLLEMGGLSTYQINALSWFLSVMVMSMLVLYPLLLKDRQVFMNVIAPLLIIVSFGILKQNTGPLLKGRDWYYVVYNGFIRGMGEMALGCECYRLAALLRKYRFRKFPSVMLGLMEHGGYLMVLIWSFHGHKNWDVAYSLIFILGLSISISFSMKGCFSGLFQHPVMISCGKFSLFIYLCHMYWRNTVPVLFPSLKYRELLIPYCILAFMTAASVSILTGFCSKNKDGIVQEFRKRCLKTTE